MYAYKCMQMVKAKTPSSEKKDAIWLESCFPFFGDSEHYNLVDKAQKQTLLQHIFLLFSFI